MLQLMHPAWLAVTGNPPRTWGSPPSPCCSLQSYLGPAAPLQGLHPLPQARSPQPSAVLPPPGLAPPPPPPPGFAPRVLGFAPPPPPPPPGPRSPRTLPARPGPHGEGPRPPLPPARPYDPRYRGKLRQRPCVPGHGGEWEMGERGGGHRGGGGAAPHLFIPATCGVSLRRDREGGGWWRRRRL